MVRPIVAFVPVEYFTSWSLHYGDSSCLVLTSPSAVIVALNLPLSFHVQVSKSSFLRSPRALHTPRALIFTPVLQARTKPQEPKKDLGPSSPKSNTAKSHAQQNVINAKIDETAHHAYLHGTQHHASRTSNHTHLTIFRTYQTSRRVAERTDKPQPTTSACISSSFQSDHLRPRRRLLRIKQML